MYCSYCFSENVTREETTAPTGVSFLGVHESWNETYEHCKDCEDETTALDELPQAVEVTDELARQLRKIWKRMNQPMPLHVVELLEAYADLYPEVA